jgi:filamentous hemagglutinin family protein
MKVNSIRKAHTRLIARAWPGARCAVVASAALALVLAGSLAYATPTGPQIVAGQVSITAAGKQLTVTNSPGSIINWQSFSIAPGELTRFVQQNASSSVLNRVTGQNPSQILGALQSNGKVFLINPNGIVFGANSRVDVNGLVASSLNLSDADFLAGEFKFSDNGKAGRVRNEGAITTPSGGQVYLIAADVANSGLITAPGGDVLLAAGRSVTLGDARDPDIRVLVSAPGDQALNVGRIVADSGRIGIYGALVEQNGAVSANSAVAGIDGKILLKSSDATSLGAGSTSTATGAGSGGSVQILGPRITLTADAVVDASGATGGGRVLIGGDLHGGNASIENALMTSVGSAVHIEADALRSGNGGEVVVWSNQQTHMDGRISARGGATGGEGGFVETSSKGLLDFNGLVDLRAPRGTAGHLLLDPTDIIIQFGDTSGDVNVPVTAPFTITGSQPTSFLSTQNLESELLLGNVTVSTTSGATAPLAGTISLNSPLTWSNANRLTLAADQSVTIGAPITATLGTLVLTAANGSITQTLNNSSAAALSVAALAASAPHGAVTLSEPTNLISGAIAGVASQGFVLVNSAGIAVGTVGNLAGIDAGTSAVTLTSAGTVTTSGAAITGSTLQISAVGGVGSAQAPLNTHVATLAGATSQGPVYLSNAADLTIDSIDATGIVNVNAAGTIATPTAAACNCSPGIAGASVTLTATGAMNIAAGSSVSASNAIALYAGYDAATATYAAPGPTLAAGGSLTAPTIALFAGGAIDTTGTTIGMVTQKPFLSLPALPTLTQCIAAPALAGCSAVLPSLAQCTTAPTTAGCNVVLPSLAQCSSAPATAGCGAVLPSVAACTVTPGLAGCVAVLPPTSAGSSASPAGQPTTSVIIALNTQVNTLIAAGSAPSRSSSSSGGDTSSTSTTAPSPTTTNTGTPSNVAAKKLYCN